MRAIDAKRERSEAAKRAAVAIIRTNDDGAKRAAKRAAERRALAAKLSLSSTERAALRASFDTVMGGLGAVKHAGVPPHAAVAREVSSSVAPAPRRGSANSRTVMPAPRSAPSASRRVAPAPRYAAAKSCMKVDEGAENYAAKRAAKKRAIREKVFRKAPER